MWLYIFSSLCLITLLGFITKGKQKAISAFMVAKAVKLGNKSLKKYKTDLFKLLNEEAR